MKLEEVRCNIGNKVKRKENGLVIYKDMIIHSFKENNGKVLVNISYHEKSTCHMVVDAKDIELSEKKMKKYKIKVTPETSVEVQKLFFALGCKWYSGIRQVKYQDNPFLFVNHRYQIEYDDDLDFFEQEGCQEITLLQLRDMVVLKRNDVGDATHVGRSGSEFYRGLKDYFFNGIEWVESQLDDTSKLFLEPIEYNRQITWQDAYIAMANGKKVQVWIADGDRWENINHHDNWSIAELAQEKLRLEPKPPQVKIETPPWEFADMTWKDAERSIKEGKNVQVFVCEWTDIGDVFKNHKFRLKPQTTHIEGGDYTKEELLKIAGEME